MAAAPSNGGPKGPGITRIAVSGFKSLANRTDLEIRPLTVLAGANSSGKSSFMQPLLLMKQTLESTIIPAGPFLLSGPYTRYTEAQQFLSRMDTPWSSPKPMTVEFDFEQGVTAGMKYAARLDSGLEVVETQGSLPNNDTSWIINRESSSDYLKSIFSQVGANPLSLRAKGLTEFSVEQYRFFQCIRVSTPAGPTSSSPSERYTMREIQSLCFEIQGLIYVSGLRGDQQRKWLLAKVGESNAFEGPFESYVSSIIESWKQSSEPGKLDALVKGLKLLDLASDIKAEKLNESEIEVRIPRTLNSASDDFVNVADVGLAVSNALPVLVALIQADPGQLVYVEQPELHLHPRAQWNLASLLVDAANRGLRLIIETHSSLLLQGILTQVALDKIANDKVILHWFERDKSTGVSTVHSAEPDAAGRVGEWPEDFGDVELRSTNEYLDAVGDKMSAQRS
ncbi:MAG: AAA family ATPase [Terriglobia bacterium]